VTVTGGNPVVGQILRARVTDSAGVDLIAEADIAEAGIAEADQENAQ
jgi:hypothetical protein